MYVLVELGSTSSVRAERSLAPTTLAIEPLSSNKAARASLTLAAIEELRSPLYSLEISSSILALRSSMPMPDRKGMPLSTGQSKS
jgi:hypothetical protein